MNTEQEKLRRAKRIESLIKGKEMTYREVALKMGVTPQTVGYWANGTSFPKKDKIQELCEILGVSVKYLIYGEEIDDPLLKNLPIKGTAKLGTTKNFFVDMEYPQTGGDGYIPFPTEDKDAYALRCSGDSMTPRIKHGEYVVIEPNKQATPGDEVLIIDKNGAVMVKIWMYTRDGMAYFSSVNDVVKTISIPVEEIEKIQFIAAIVKSALKKEFQ